MEYSGESFLKILNDDSPTSYGDATPTQNSSITWNDDATPTQNSSITWDDDATPTQNSSITWDDDATPTQNSSITWDDDDASFEVGEVTNVGSSDQNLAGALKAIDTTSDGIQNDRSQSVAFALDGTSISRQNSVKEELKAKIQTRRKSEGIGELRVKFEPPKSYALTPEEKAKVEKRKRRNRLSANKSRQRRKELEDTLQKQVEDLQTENDKLSKDVKFLSKVKEILRLKLETHQCTKHVDTSSLQSDLAGSSCNVTTSSTTGACTRGSTTPSSKGKIYSRVSDGLLGNRTISKTQKRCFEPLTT